MSGADAAEDLKETRFYLEKLFNPDSTVWPSLRNSVMNIPSQWLVRSFTNAEANIGAFIYDILNTPIKGKASKAIPLIREALKDHDDDLTRTIKPLIARTPEADRIEHFEPDSKDITWNEAKLIIRQGFDRLADNCERNTTNSLLTLRRIVAYTMFNTNLFTTHMILYQFSLRIRPKNIGFFCKFRPTSHALTGNSHTLAECPCRCGSHARIYNFGDS